MMLDSGSVLPPAPAITLTPEEQTFVSEQMNQIYTYVDENSMKFIVGQRPMSEWNDFIDGFDRFDVERVLEIHNKALAVALGNQ